MRGESCAVFVLCPLVLVVCFAAAFIIGYDDSAPYVSGRHLRGPAKAKLGRQSRTVSRASKIRGKETRRSREIEDALRGDSEELQASAARETDLEAADGSSGLWRRGSDLESMREHKAANEAEDEVAEEVDDASDSGLNLPFALRWPDTHPLIADLHRRRLTFSHEKAGVVDVENRPALEQESSRGMSDDAIANLDMEWPSDLWPEIFASVEDEALGGDLPFSLRWPETNPLVADLKG